MRCTLDTERTVLRPFGFEDNAASLRVAAQAGLTRHHVGGDGRGQLIYLVSPRFAEPAS